MNNTALLIINIGKKTTLISFTGGTVLFLSFCLFRNSFLVAFGMFYLSITVLINLFVMLALIVSCFIYSTNRTASISTLLLQLVNIPIAILYFLIVTSITL